MASDSKASTVSMGDLLRLPGFRAFWLANLISNLGTSAFVLAITWLTVKQYGSAGIATLALAYGLPQMLLQLVGGTLCDRINRKRLFAITQSGMLIASLLILAASSQEMVPLWLLALVNAVNGVISAFDTPARTALVTDLVEPHQVSVAQELYSLTSSVTNIFGPALGGVLLSLGPTARSHEEVAFAFDALSFVPLLISIAWLPRGSGAAGVSNTGQSFRASMQAGLQMVRNRVDLRTMLLLLALVMGLGMPFQGLLPVFVHSHLNAEGGAHLLRRAYVGRWAGQLCRIVAWHGLTGTSAGRHAAGGRQCWLGDQRADFERLKRGALGLTIGISGWQLQLSGHLHRQRLAAGWYGARNAGAHQRHRQPH